MSIFIMLDEAEFYKRNLNIAISPESLYEFQELVQRATNLWPDAPPEIKEFADQITTGSVQQDYASQSPPPVGTTGWVHYHRCSCGWVTPAYTIDSAPPDYPIRCENKTIIVVIPVPDSETGETTEKIVPCTRMEPFKHFNS